VASSGDATRYSPRAGDYVGDGRSAILWRDDVGTLVLWRMDGTNVLANTSLGDDDAWSIA
jgi:hypothetical protein